jgi:hypothetical protein
LPPARQGLPYFQGKVCGKPQLPPRRAGDAFATVVAGPWHAARLDGSAVIRG